MLLRYFQTIRPVWLLFSLIVLADAALAQDNPFILEHADQVELVNQDDGSSIFYLSGNVRFKTDSGTIYCDTAIYKQGQSVRLKGHVKIIDVAYKLLADSAFYNLTTKEAEARGKNVELWSYDDSLYAVGRHAFFNRNDKYFQMFDRPILYLNYPDTAQMIEIIADEIEYSRSKEKVEAFGNVLITSNDLSSESGCAIMDIRDKNLDLSDSPTAHSGKSTVSGSLISIIFENDKLSQLIVLDSARGEILEPVDSLNNDFDRAELKADRLYFNFENGELKQINCMSNAYSWYYPSLRGNTEFNENEVSGDEIILSVINDELAKIRVLKGAVGMFVSGKVIEPSDSSLIKAKNDTIYYNAELIDYDLRDSLITLNNKAVVKSGTVSLAAEKILFDTRKKVVKAYSASVTLPGDSTSNKFIKSLQPNSIPVRLTDKNEDVYGDYLEYSVATKKGRIIQSKSSYTEGIYYGEKLFREQEDIFYVQNGSYTTCDADQPHFSFSSTNMKLIENDKLIARPVVFYIEKIPIIILPFYVFPLKRGRHSGLLPFTFGKFQQGDRYVNDIGYYWALSDYTDLKTSFDYHEKNKTIIFKGNFNFNKIYSLNGNISGHFSRETGYDYSIAEEVKRSRWIARGRYNHNITPTFKVTANADFQSDKTYYNDLSQNLNERLNRLTKSRLNFTKRFGKSTSLSGEISHTVNLDLETRTDLFPNLSLTLPTIYLFGKGKQDAQGKLKQNWFNKLTFRYSPRMTNYSNRVSPIDTIVTTLDTLGNILSADTTRFRSRKKYTRISHNPALNLPTLKLFKYFSLTPRVSYSETWYKIHETDQSIAAGIDASTTYRTYSYNAGASFKTNLYGIVRPNLFGVKAVRHVLTPIISYSYSPDIDLYPDVRSFAGGGAGSRKTSSVSVTLSQLFQAKVGEEEKERNLNLLSFSSSFRYNFLAEGKSFSTLSSNFQSSALKYISFDGTLQHSLYDPDTDEKRVLSPVLLSFSLNARMTLFGKRFLFDEMIHDPASGQRDSARINNSQNLSSQNNYASRAKTNSKGWSMSATYSFSESGRLENYFKRSFLRFNLNFNLTNSTSIAYSQSYDFSSGRTVNSSVNIIRTIHCWSGSLYWVPSGSNRGFGFKLFVTALPEIKLDNAHDNFLKGVQR